MFLSFRVVACWECNFKKLKKGLQVVDGIRRDEDEDEDEDEDDCAQGAETMKPSI